MRTFAIRCLAAGFLLTALHAPGTVAFGEATASDPQAGKAPDVDLRAIRERAGSMPIDARTDMDKRIGATVERVNRRALEQGQSVMAARLAAEFSVTSEALLEEKGAHGWSWGEAMIAYTLLANTPKGVTVLDLAHLRSDGLGWAAIAYGLKFRMEDFEDAIKAQGRVAMGLNQADGKAETIGR
jgi:hypothetical protein